MTNLHLFLQMMEWYPPATSPTTTTTPQPDTVRFSAQSGSGEWQGYEPRWTTLASTLATESTTSAEQFLSQPPTSTMYQALSSTTQAPMLTPNPVQAFSNLTQEMVDRFISALNATFSTTEPPLVVAEKSEETRQFVSLFLAH